MFFHTWMDLLRTLIVGTLAYIWLAFFQRISGKRTLSKMNAFDLIVTVALGSSLATILLSKDVSLAEGALVIALLMGLQYVVTWLSVHLKGVDRVVKAEPTLLPIPANCASDSGDIPPLIPGIKRHPSCSPFAPCWMPQF